MKTLRYTCAAIILALTLTLSVLAGEIDCPGVVAPTPTPTPAPAQMQTETTTATVTSSITVTIIFVIIDLIP
jgi:hypothetical protein